LCRPSFLIETLILIYLLETTIHPIDPRGETMSKFTTRAATIAAVVMLMGGTASAAMKCSNTAQGFDGFKKSVIKEARANGMGEAAIAAVAATKYDPSIIKKDRAQNIFSQSFLEFQARMATDYRVKRGAELIATHKTTFDAVQKKYGVPAPVIAAFWALETDFGATLGSDQTMQALMTLSWDCRRPEKFRPQIGAAMQLINNGDLQPDDMRGAWAGEIGQTQFMAYDYLESAIDFDGDGKRDLRNSIPDVLASTANLLRTHGWKPGQPWLQEVKVPADMPWAEADIAVQHPRSQWAQWGVKAASGKNIKADNMPVSLLLPMGKNGPAFFAYHNFTKAYLKWNESLVYSTTAAYLATRMAGAPKVGKGRAPVAHLKYEQIVNMQDMLLGLGYDVGKVDGKIGKGTRAAIKEMQVKFGMPADSYPTAAFIDKLQDSQATGSTD
jgi:lytic murein transglycosylase